MIPKAAQYYNAGMNVLLIGLHGVGKTEAILDMCREENVVLKYYSCSTLDPFTDLVGVPTPRMYCTGCRVHYATTAITCPLDSSHGDLIESLKMVRPHEIDMAELLFFDEFNRAGDYKVSDLDPALIDRFDVFIDINPKPSVAYMQQTLPKPIAQALFSWWSEHNQARRGLDNYISPRRLMKIGQVHQATGDFRPAIPKWIACDKTKLGALLEQAENDLKKLANKVTSGLGDGPNPRFTYDDKWLATKRTTVARYLRDNQQDFDTHQAVLNVIKDKHGNTLARDFAEILDSLKPSMLEGYISSLNPGKHTSLKSAVSDLPPHRYEAAVNLRRELALI
jgi:hypothetical protein